MMARYERLMHWWIGVQAPVAEPLIYAAAYAALLAAIVLAINLCARRWLSAGQMAVLWGLVLIRLALPAAPAMALSLGTLWNQATAGIERLMHPEAPLVVPLPDAGINSQNVTAAAESGGAAALNLYAAGQPSLAPAVVEESAAEPLWMTVFTFIALTIWVVFPFVAIGILVWTAVVHVRLCRFLRRQIPTRDERLLSILNESRAVAGVTRTISLFAIAELQQPAVVGVWSTKILLPMEAAELSDERLRLLLLHELAHVRRGDVVINWLLAVLRALHWWNPVYWLAASRYCALREQACDAFAVARCGEVSSREYGEMLLHFAASGVPRTRWLVSIPASLLGISSGLRAGAMKRRLNALRSATRSRGVLQRGMVATLALGLAVTGWSEAKDRVPEAPVDRWVMLPSQVPDWSVRPVEAGDVVSVELDVSDALRRHRELGMSSEGSEAGVRSLLEPFFYSRWLVSDDRKTARPDPDSALAEHKIEGNILKLTARQSIVDEVSHVLDVWKETGFRQISMECRIINAKSDLASSAGIGWRSMGQLGPPESPLRLGKPDQQLVVGVSASIETPLPVCVAALNNSQAFQLVKNAQGDRRANIMFAPKPTVFNGASARLSDVLSRPFVVGIEENDDGSLKPTIRTFEEGLKLRLCPTDNREGTRIRLTGRVEFSDISDVTTATARTKSGREVNIQIPRVNRVCIDVDSEIAKDETLLVGCLPSYERKEFVYLLITPRRLEGIDDLGRTKEEVAAAKSLD